MITLTPNAYFKHIPFPSAYFLISFIFNLNASARTFLSSMISANFSSISDEDIPTIVTPPPHDVDQPIAAKKSNDEIRIGPITRARAKLIEQQVNSLLIESDYFLNENGLLPKTLYICMIRFNGEEGIAQGRKEEQHLELDVE